MVPTLEQLLQGAHAFSVPLTHRFRRVEHREGLLIEGPSGWGEFAPFVGYNSPTAARWLAAAIESAYGSWPSVEATRVAVNAIIPAVSLDAAVALAHVAVGEQGCRTIKVKVAEPMQSTADDAARLRALRATVGSGVAIRIDANAAWSVAQAAAALPALIDAAGGIEYVEQPCASLAEIAQLRDQLASPGDAPTVRIAVDEAVRLEADPFDPDLHARIRACADVLIVKVAPLGGVEAARRIAESVGLPTVVSSAMDTSVGLSAGATLAAMIDGGVAHGLGTGSLLGADVTRQPLVPSAGSIAVGRVAVDPDLLAAAAARLAPDRITWWRQRLADAYPHLAALPTVPPR